jgi:intergrase/recombinase
MAYLRIRDAKSVVSKFQEHCAIDERLQPRVCRDYRNTVLRFLRFTKGEVSQESVRAYLSSYVEKAPKTYNNQLCGLRAFVMRFLKRKELMEGFKKAHEDSNLEVELPSKAQLRKGFESLTDDKERAIYLMYASSGLRQMELRRLSRFEDVDFRLRVVKSKHNTRTKKAGVTFCNEECEVYLKRYLSSRRDSSETLLPISNCAFYAMWRKVSKCAGVRITPQVLRKWHSTELGELGVPDRYVDVFQGRAPKTVITKFYTGKELERLKRFYDKAGLKVLS